MKGQERTLGHYRALLASGGFRLLRSIPTSSGAFILESIPVEVP